MTPTRITPQLVLILSIPVSVGGCRQDAPAKQVRSSTMALYSGSESCRDCHEKFYELWSTSFHGLAMRPYSQKLAHDHLVSQERPITIKGKQYHVRIARGEVVEKSGKGTQTYRLAHVMGGKNVYYFLTPFDRGRLQVLPIAYDVQKKAWYDTARSGVRHFPDRADEALDWTDPAFTFNTSCWGCHVSQLSKNYDIETDTYQTTWREPGISCETCHGPSAEHVALFKGKPKGFRPKDPKIISIASLSVTQVNDSCLSCHAKMSPITDSFVTGSRFFDHFDLTTLEDADFYPDGRDLGENYTMTGWLMSPCVKDGKLSCLHCHTSSGRYRFSNLEDANKACLPCHDERVRNVEKHSRHRITGEGGKCVACHMPKTRFAAMTRSDHSMRPPTPITTLRFKSPNACNICHSEKEVSWAADWVRTWHKGNYQDRVMKRAEVLAAARKRDWSRLGDMLAILSHKDTVAVYRTALIRLLEHFPDERKWPALLARLKDTSPLVRAAAARALGNHLTPETIVALVETSADAARLVRIRAAASLTPVPLNAIPTNGRAKLARALAELEASFAARPDDFASHYNLGNYHQTLRQFDRAIAAYKQAIRLRPDTVAPYVNLAMTYANTKAYSRAKDSLNKALAIDPGNAPANFNLGLLLAQMGDKAAAEKTLRQALATDPNLAPAAYNLGILLVEGRPKEALSLLERARKLLPHDPKVAFTAAFYLEKSKQRTGAIRILRPFADDGSATFDIYALLGDLYGRSGKRKKARETYATGAADQRLSDRERAYLQNKATHGR